MTDTPLDVDAAFTALFAERSGSDRVRMMAEMFEDAKALMAADIKARDPDITANELRIRIFERLYHDDLTPELRALVLADLSEP